MRTKENILTGLMLLLLTACSSSSDSVDVVPEPNNGDGNRNGSYEQSQRSIGFSGFFDDGVGEMASAPATRGVGDGEFTNADLQASGFGVYCWYTGAVPYPINTDIRPITKDILMLNQKVEYKNGLWTYSPSKYWPLKDDEVLTFRAYAPYVSYQLQMDANGMPMLPVVVTKDDYHYGKQHDPLWGTGRLLNGTEYKPLPDRASYDTEEDFEEALKNYYRYGSPYDNITYEMSGDNRLKETLPADTRNGYIDWYFHHGMSKLMFTCSVIQDPGCDRVVIRSIQIEDLYTQGLLSLSSPTASESEKPIWPEAQRSGNMKVKLDGATTGDGGTTWTPGDLAQAPGDDTDPSYHPYPFVITTSTTQATDPADLLSHGLLIIPRDFTTEPMKVTITYSIDDDTELLTATGTINQNFKGNTSYTVRLSLTPSTRGLEISLVQGAFTKWQVTVVGTHEVYNW